MPVFDALLSLLKENRSLPHYQAERRIDIFVNLFLAELLSDHYDDKVIFVAPEFPFKNPLGNRSKKLDYLCAFAATKQPIFVELKTDVRSFGEARAKGYFEKAQDWPACIKNLVAIIAEGSITDHNRHKYSILMSRLLDTGLVLPATAPQDRPDRSTARIINVPGKPIYKLGVSRDSINLSEYISIQWDQHAELIYLGPKDAKMRGKIEGLSKDRPDSKVSPELLDFAQIANRSTNVDTKYPEEFRRFADFLRDLT
jgi:hypothetical protein